MGRLFDCFEAVDCVVVKIGVPVGDPWVIGEPGTRQQKRWQKKLAENKLFTPVFSSTTRQSTINQQSIRYNQSGKMDYADVNDT